MKSVIALMMATGLVLATPGAFSADEDSGKDREALRKEMAEARRAMAEAARRVAEIGRELGLEAGENVAFRILDHDGPRRAMLGIAIGDDEGGKGVEVLSVTPGGPADKAGIQAGDAITAIGKTDLTQAESPSRALVKSLHDAEPGSVIDVKYRRGNDDRTAKVTVEAFSPRLHMFAREFDGIAPLPGAPHAPMFLELMHGWGDIELVSLSERLGEYFGTDEGLLVVRAPQEEEFKLQDGDVILAIDGRAPEDPAHAMRILRSYRGGEKLTLDILRKKKKMTLEIDVPERRSSEHLPFEIKRKVVGEAPAPR